MILLSVGTQLPFDRLVEAVDQWASRHPEVEVIAQIGPSNYRPTAMKSCAFFEPDRFRKLQAQCSLMVSHAGIGSIINALELGKPIIILGRDHRRHEHRNGHQISTITRFGDLPGIYAARDEIHLMELLDRVDLLAGKNILPPSAPEDFIKNIENYAANAKALPFWRILWRLFFP
ncbi:glycosyltransferase [Novosphingobium sediminicola]|uniref:UDP-N-acetylglucosamine transferase subunit ALG13 n=1 Tax=Novosphingobium sediminicola TaxID=563162 RepID=A0A7W6G833_9SPHN|nr:glycosyltransferase [Novosphingobium sediminicola]MBB3956815.1 UDP-N-acetylglucosamine transferase subunit ALG13 [Novosphingobium sediminicola]